MGRGCKYGNQNAIFSWISMPPPESKNIIVFSEYNFFPYTKYYEIPNFLRPKIYDYSPMESIVASAERAHFRIYIYIYILGTNALLQLCI